MSLSNDRRLVVNYLPPQALDVEEVVLGASLIEAYAHRTLISLLPVEAFYHKHHQLIYKAILALADDGQPIDFITVANQLRAHGTFDRVGGYSFVVSLTKHVSSAANLEKHCRILLEHYARRVIINAGSHLQTYGYDKGRDPLGLLSEAQVQLINLHQAIDKRPAQSVADIFDGVFADLAEAVDRQGLTGVPTGMQRLNDATGGWQRGDLVIIAARPAMGKSALMLHAARVASLDYGKHTAVFSLEMPKNQLVQRLIAGEVQGYTNSDLRRAELSGGLEEVEHIRKSAVRLKNQGHRLLIDETAGLSIQELRAKCSRLHAEYGLGLVVIDYIQLMSGDKKGNREQEISSITRGLKLLAKELNVPVLALSQLSRAVETRGGEKRPQLSDLRESGSIEQDADLVIFLWRGEYYKIKQYADGSSTTNTLLIDIAKHRNGGVGEIIVGCEMPRGVFYDLDIGGNSMIGPSS